MCFLSPSQANTCSFKFKFMLVVDHPALLQSLFCSLMLKTAGWSKFSQQDCCRTPPRRFWVFILKPPNSTLSAMLFEQVRDQQCCYQRTCLNPVFLPSLPNRVSHLLRSAFFSGSLKDCFNSSKPCQESLRFLWSSTSESVRC